MPKQRPPPPPPVVRVTVPRANGSAAEMREYAANPAKWRQRERVRAAGNVGTGPGQHRMYVVHDGGGGGQAFLVVPVDGRVPLLDAGSVDRAFYRNQGSVTSGANSWLFWNHVWRGHAAPEPPAAKGGKKRKMK